MYNKWTEDYVRALERHWKKKHGRSIWSEKSSEHWVEKYLRMEAEYGKHITAENAKIMREVEKRRK